MGSDEGDPQPAPVPRAERDSMNAPRSVRRARGVALLTTLLAVTFALVRGCGQDGPAAPETAAELAGELTAAQLVGQRMLYALAGTEVNSDVASRLRQGRAAGVILFERNYSSAGQMRRLIATVQRLASASPIGLAAIVAIDQEDGAVRRVPGAPRRGAAEMGATLTPAEIELEGAATGRTLSQLGINVDLAPVADVGRPGGALVAERRTFAANPETVSAAASAFASGLDSEGVAATAKHFPGLGSAQTNTDVAAVVVRRGESEAAADTAPFRVLVDAGVELVMLSTAIYPELAAKPGALSPEVSRLLREDLGFEGVTITDALDTPALEAYASADQVAIEAVAGGVDLLVYAGSTGPGLRAEEAILSALRRGELRREDMERSAARVLQLRAGLTDSAG